jgi:hypothetical protein
MTIKHKIRVTTPAGKCPVALAGTDDIAINSWIKEVRASRPQYYLAKTALKYWVRHTYPCGQPEYIHVVDRIDKLIKED